MTATENATKTFLEAHNGGNGFRYLWLTSFSHPAGVEFRHNKDTEDEDEYCDFSELHYFEDFADLTGTVTESGRWEWDGKDKVFDIRGNSIYRIVAM